MNLAVDSRPLTGDIFSALDYSGLQVHGLSHLPLHKALRKVRSSVGGTKWKVELGEHFWDDGRAVRSEEYLAGLRRLVAAQPRFAAYLRSAVKKISFSRGALNFEFDRVLVSAAALFETPNWVPFRAGHFSGEYKVIADAGGWALRDRAGEEGRVRLVNSPAENERLFAAGRLDFSADTALPLDALDPSVRRRDTGLFGLLVYSSKMTDRRAQALNATLGDLRFSAEIEAAYPRLRPFYSGRAPAQSIRLAYDKFYPNRQVCEQIAAHLVRRGWRVALVGDDYYRPAAPSDLKFMILRHAGPRGIFPSLTMAALPRATVKTAGLSETVARLETGAEYDVNWISKLRLGFPLFAIPSLYRARNPGPNPLLEVFP